MLQNIFILKFSRIFTVNLNEVHELQASCTSYLLLDFQAGNRECTFGISVIISYLNLFK